MSSSTSCPSLPLIPSHHSPRTDTDRQYLITDLPDYMHGLWGIKTANDDKHSDATHLEFLCFDISHKVMLLDLFAARLVNQVSLQGTSATTAAPAAASRETKR